MPRGRGLCHAEAGAQSAARIGVNMSGSASAALARRWVRESAWSDAAKEDLDAALEHARGKVGLQVFFDLAYAVHGELDTCLARTAAVHMLWTAVDLCDDVADGDQGAFSLMQRAGPGAMGLLFMHGLRMVGAHAGTDALFAATEGLAKAAAAQQDEIRGGVWTEARYRGFTDDACGAQYRAYAAVLCGAHHPFHEPWVNFARASNVLTDAEEGSEGPARFRTLSDAEKRSLVEWALAMHGPAVDAMHAFGVHRVVHRNSDERLAKTVAQVGITH